MNEQAIAATRRWFTEGWTGAVELADALFAADLVTNGVAVGIDGPKRNVRNRLVGFPDLETEIEDLFAAGDRIVTRVRWHGTHTGPYSNVPPTGRPVDIRTIAVWRFRDGQVFEIWTLQDQFGLLQQVGLITSEFYSAQVPAGVA